MTYGDGSLVDNEAYLEIRKKKHEKTDLQSQIAILQKYYLLGWVVSQCSTTECIRRFRRETSLAAYLQHSDVGKTHARTSIRNKSIKYETN